MYSPFKALKFKVVVKILEEEEFIPKRATDAKIVLPAEFEERNLHASMTGIVVDIGEECACPELKIGDKVCFVSYQGAAKKIGDINYRIMNDIDIMAIYNPVENEKADKQ